MEAGLEAPPSKPEEQAGNHVIAGEASIKVALETLPQVPKVEEK